MAVTKQIKIAYKDIEREVVKDGEVVAEVIDAATQAAIVKQVNEEYDVAFPHTEAKRAIMLARLQLYNNQRRDADAVGDPLMFTVFNTVLASLYDDRLAASWEGRGGSGDEDTEENLNALAEFDYDIMQKDELDYDWDWDACFFGRALMLMMDFDRTAGIMAPVPEVIDPTTWIRDPKAKSVNGDARGRGGMRFGGYETGATYYELKKLPGYFNIGSLNKDKETRSLGDEASEARNLAQGRDNFPQKEESLGKYNNYEFKLLNWFTSIKGEKYLITLGNRRSVVTRVLKLKYGNKWPIIDRALYPIAHDWDGVSIPDLTEDKQRMRAVLLNLGVISAKADTMPRFLYDNKKITNKNELNYRSNKYIGVAGDPTNALIPVQKSNSDKYASLIMDALDTAAQRAAATPEIQMGAVGGKDRTLGELNLVSSKVDTRYSMSAKIFGWSERAFWRQWYRQYKIHFKDEIDEKVVRVQGAMAPLWRPLLRENIIADVDPDVKIESRVISEAKRERQRMSYERFAGIALQDPDANRRFIQKKLAKLNGMKKEEIDMAFPPTVDEMQASDENEQMNAGKLPPVGIQDDHRTHIEVHAKANQTPESMAHIRAHKKLMIVKRNRPDLFPAPSAMGLKVPGQESMPGAPSAAQMTTPSAPMQ